MEGDPAWVSGGKADQALVRQLPEQALELPLVVVGVIHEHDVARIGWTMFGRIAQHDDHRPDGFPDEFCRGSDSWAEVAAGGRAQRSEGVQGL